MQGLEISAFAKEMEWEEYLVPATLEEALEALERYGGGARVLAGGTDVVPLGRKGGMGLKAAVDITRLPGLSEIRLDGETIRIGALVTHAEVAKSPLIRDKATALAEGASRLGSPQTRNIGTVAGNVVNAQPGADSVIPLLALDASVTVRSRRGERTVPLTELFTGVGTSTIDSTREIVTEISFPSLQDNEVSAATRLAKRKGLALPILTAAVVVRVDAAHRVFTGARIAVGPVATTPFRCKGAEELLTGSAVGAEAVKRAAADAAKAANPRTSLVRGSADYRKAMVAVLVERSLDTALERLERSNG
jgi:carbon-monoxide dehydrogenase medium subunit